MSIDESVEPMVPNGCLAMFVSTAFAALLITLGAAPSFGSSLFLYVPVFIVTTIIATSVGLPLFHLVRHFGRANIWMAAGGGMVTGAGIPALIAFSVPSVSAWIGVAAYGIAGTTGGLMFLLIQTAPQNPRANVAAMLMLAAISIAAILLIQPKIL